MSTVSIADNLSTVTITYAILIFPQNGIVVQECWLSRSGQLMNRNPAIMSVAPRRSPISNYTHTYPPTRRVITACSCCQYVDMLVRWNLSSAALNHSSTNTTNDKKKGERGKSSSHSRAVIIYTRVRELNGGWQPELPSPAIILPLRPRFCALQRGTQFYAAR